MVRHRVVPTRRNRWIGIVLYPGVFGDHCLVMFGDRIGFDPVDLMPDSGTIDGTSRRSSTGAKPSKCARRRLGGVSASRKEVLSVRAGPARLPETG
jgi:hypothetical protein